MFQRSKINWLRMFVCLFVFCFALFVCFFFFQKRSKVGGCSYYPNFAKKYAILSGVKELVKTHKYKRNFKSRVIICVISRSGQIVFTFCRNRQYTFLFLFKKVPSSPVSNVSYPIPFEDKLLASVAQTISSSVY